MLRSASILGLQPIYEEQENKKPDWTKVKSAIINKIENTFSNNDYVLVRPVGDCLMLKTTLPFLALKKINQKNRLIIKSRRKDWILGELRALGAFPDILEHVDNYHDSSPEMTLLSQALFHGSTFESGRRLLQQLIQFLDLTPGSNQLIRSVYDPEFQENNAIPMLQWARVLNQHANQASDAASRANLIANYLIDLGRSNPDFQSTVGEIIKKTAGTSLTRISIYRSLLCHIGITEL